MSWINFFILFVLFLSSKNYLTTVLNHSFELSFFFKKNKSLSFSLDDITMGFVFFCRRNTTFWKKNSALMFPHLELVSWLCLSFYYWFNFFIIIIFFFQQRYLQYLGWRLISDFTISLAVQTAPWSQCCYEQRESSSLAAPFLTTGPSHHLL